MLRRAPNDRRGGHHQRGVLTALQIFGECYQAPSQPQTADSCTTSDSRVYILHTPIQVCRTETVQVAQLRACELCAPVQARIGKDVSLHSSFCYSSNKAPDFLPVGGKPRLQSYLGLSCKSAMPFCDIPGKRTPPPLSVGLDYFPPLFLLSRGRCKPISNPKPVAAICFSNLAGGGTPVRLGCRL